MDQDNKMNDLIEKLGRGNIREFIRRLKHIGNKGKYLLLRSHWEENVVIQTTNTKQFVIAAAVSEGEIVSQDFTIIDDMLRHLYKRSEVDPVKTYEIALIEGPVVILLNDKTRQPSSHGEGILLDPDGWLQRRVLGWNGSCPRTSVDYLREMKSSYRKRHGNESDLVLFLYSHYIPCDYSRHMCSEIIRTYALGLNDSGKPAKGERVIVAYDNVHELVDEENAFTTLITRNSHVVPPDQESNQWEHALDFIDDMWYLRWRTSLGKRYIKRFHKTV